LSLASPGALRPLERALGRAAALPDDWLGPRVVEILGGVDVRLHGVGPCLNGFVLFEGSLLTVKAHLFYTLGSANQFLVGSYLYFAFALSLLQLLAFLFLVQLRNSADPVVLMRGVFLVKGLKISLFGIQIVIRRHGVVLPTALMLDGFLGRVHDVGRLVHVEHESQLLF